MMKRLHEKASITVFLSLLLVLFIGFIMMMTEHARIFGLRQRLVCATDSAMDSLFSMYDRELLNEFDLMLLNENELSNNQDIEEVVSKYLTMNANPKQDHLLLSGNLYRGTSSTAEIENTVSVIENEGELFARSVLEFMKYRTLGIAVEKVQEQLEELEMGDDAKTMAKEQQEIKDNYTYLGFAWLKGLSEVRYYDLRNEASKLMADDLCLHVKEQPERVRLVYEGAEEMEINPSDEEQMAKMFTCYLLAGSMDGYGEFVDYALDTHRTLQQNLTRFFVEWFAKAEKGSAFLKRAKMVYSRYSLPYI